MKFFLVLALLLVGVWLWRSNRAAKPALKARNSPRRQAPLEMASCALCSVHIAVVDAVEGKKGLYCCLDHRQRAEP